MPLVWLVQKMKNNEPHFSVVNVVNHVVVGLLPPKKVNFPDFAFLF